MACLLQPIQLSIALFDIQILFEATRLCYESILILLIKLSEFI